MKSKKVVSSFRVGQVVTHRGERVRIKAFPNPYTAVIVPERMAGAMWTVKTVAVSDLIR
jgi:hypothetical protein